MTLLPVNDGQFKNVALPLLPETSLVVMVEQLKFAQSTTPLNPALAVSPPFMTQSLPSKITIPELSVSFTTLTEVDSPAILLIWLTATLESIVHLINFAEDDSVVLNTCPNPLTIVVCVAELEIEIEGVVMDVFQYFTVPYGLNGTPSD
ncbi:MAG: hypothetical protein IKF72_05040 [Kiritimatiellae bacterium]|nr:hypothetical protein [Kiritimatiellia bacterium]